MIDILILYIVLAGYKTNTHIMGQNPQELPQVNSVPQRVSGHIQHPVPPAYQTEFNSSPFTTGLCWSPHLASGSLPPAASSPLIHQPSLNPSLSEPATIPSKGVIQRVLHLLILRSFIGYKIVHGTSGCISLHGVDADMVCTLTFHRYMCHAFMYVSP